MIHVTEVLSVRSEEEHTDTYLHLRVHKNVPVNAFCDQQETTHDYLGSESGVHILEGLRDVHM
jgi:hypothetical protein